MTSKRILGWTLVFVSSMGLSQALAHTSDKDISSTLKLGVLPKVGTYKIRIDNYGEPAKMALRFSVELDCGAKRPVVAFSDLAGCGGGELKMDKDKKLVFSYLKPDSKEECAQQVTESIAPKKICK